MLALAVGEWLRAEVRENRTDGGWLLSEMPSLLSCSPFNQLITQTLTVPWLSAAFLPPSSDVISERSCQLFQQ